MASKWRYGCGEEILVFIPRGFGFREVKVECGSTAHDGGVNQCTECEQKFNVPPPREDEGDLEYDHRIHED